MRKIRKNSRRSLKQTLLIIATIAVLPTMTGALADTLAESIGQAPGYQVAPPARPTLRRARGSRIEHLEQVASKLRLRVQRLEAEGQEHRASTLQYRLSRIETELGILRAT